MTPGRNCSTRMSARSTKPLMSLCPPSVLRSAAVLFLPPFSTVKAAAAEPKFGGKRRMSSPPSFSTLITSAPASASMKVASGPGSRVEKSRMVMPSRGSVIVAGQPGKRSGVILPVLMNQRKAVSVAIETRVPARTQAEARSTPISYCVAMTKMLSAGGSAAMTIAANVQVGSKSPERREQHPDEERVQDELDRDERRHLAGHAQDRPQRHGDAEEEERAWGGGLRQPGDDLVDRGGRLEPQIGSDDADHGRDIERVGRDLP